MTWLIFDRFTGTSFRRQTASGTAFMSAEPLRLFYVIIQHLLELLMIQSDKLAYLTDLSGSRGRTSGETALSAHSEEHEVF